MLLKRFIFYLGVLTLPFAVLSSCSKDKQADENIQLKEEDYTEQAYGTHQRQKLDMYLPAARDNTTGVVIFIHGGFWYQGDKSMFTTLAKYYRSKGYATATINYRLTHTSENNIHPAQLDDIGKAIEFINGKAADWKIAANKYALAGASAGGHLALLYTYTRNNNNAIKTAISMAGPVDFTDLRNANPLQSQVLEWYVGATYQANPAAFVQVSPVTHVSANSKPTLIFQGKADVIVPFQQSVTLKAKLDQFGVKNKLLLYEGVGHDFAGVDSDASFLAECETWFRENLK